MFIGLKVQQLRMIIHGEITKIYEVEKDAYTQQITGGGWIDAYSFGFTVAPGLWYITFSFPLPILFHSINVSSSDVSVMQRVYLIKYPELNVLGDFYYYFRYTPRQFFLGDVKVDLSATNSFVRIYFENNAVGNRTFRGSIWYTHLT